MTMIDTSATTPAASGTSRERDVWFAGTLMRILADAGSTGGQFAVIEQESARGFSPPTHVHHREDQFLYVIEGAITARVGDHESTLGAGDAVWLPRDTPHTFRIDSDTARLLEVTAPAGFEEFHVDAGDPAPVRELPPPSEPDVPRMLAALGRYGAEIVGPPMSA